MTVERESVTQRKVIDIIRKYGGYVYKNAQSMYTEVGRPDLTCCIPTTLGRLKEQGYDDDTKIGLFVGIEMKRPGNLKGVSNSQKIVGKQIKKAGGIWLLIDDPFIIEALMMKFTDNYE